MLSGRLVENEVDWKWMKWDDGAGSPERKREKEIVRQRNENAKCNETK